ncbi:hypothetical protein [Phytohabitans rumicis]|uniref:hypothetical protein n=1 Tax=Phytohabitans rumicis TaxID=1076125 RepID=UPI001565375D|nr:hypothetical protein [Phytohabitans rumicis]
MSAETQTTVGVRPARVWWTAAAAVAAGAATVTTVAQATGRFHWWAGFVLIPGAVIAAAGAPLLARGGGRAFTGYLIAWVGAIVFTVGALLMFGAMDKGWPLMIILPTVAVAGTYAWRAGHPLARAFHRTIATLALAGTALGVTFLLMQADAVDFGETNWWGGFMMAGAVIIVLNGLELLRHRIEYRVQAIALAVFPAALVFLIGLRIFRGDWPY